MCCQFQTMLFLACLAILMLLATTGQAEDQLARAGCPHQIAWYARTGYGDRYIVYYVGGGAKVHRGECRRSDEGNFGVDYMPIVPGFREAVALNWWHGSRLQGGTGQYEPNKLVAPLPNANIRAAQRRGLVD